MMFFYLRKITTEWTTSICCFRHDKSNHKEFLAQLEQYREVNRRRMFTDDDNQYIEIHASCVKKIYGDPKVAFPYSGHGCLWGKPWPDIEKSK